MEEKQLFEQSNQPLQSPINPTLVASPTNVPPATPQRGWGRFLSISAGIAGFLVVLLLIGGGAALAGRVWDPQWNPFRPSPDKVIMGAITQLKEVHTFHTDTAFEYGISGSPGLNRSSSVKVVGDSDITDSTNLRGKGTVTILASTEAMPNEISFNANYRVIDKNIYFSMLTFLLEGQDVNDTQGKWIKVNYDYIKKDINSEAKSFDPTVFSDQLKSMFSDTSLYVFKKKLPDQIIDGQKIYDYRVMLNNDKIATKLEAIVERIATQDGTNESVPSWATAGAVKGIINEFLEKMGEVNIDIGIGSKDGYVYMTSIEKTIDLGMFGNGMQGSLKISAHIATTKFNEPISVQPPEEFIDIETIIPSSSTIQNKSVVPIKGKNYLQGALLKGFTNILNK